MNWILSLVGGAICLWCAGLLVQPLRDTLDESVKCFLYFDCPAVRVQISTSIPHCATGRVMDIFGDGEVAKSVQFRAGADQTRICDNGIIVASRAKLPQELVNIYPGCFELSYGRTAAQITLQTDSEAVCRAAFREINFSLEKVTPEQGTNICIGPLARIRKWKAVSERPEFPRECKEEELKRYGYL